MFEVSRSYIFTKILFFQDSLCCCSSILKLIVELFSLKTHITRKIFHLSHIVNNFPTPMERKGMNLNILEHSTIFIPLQWNKDWFVSFNNWKGSWNESHELVQTSETVNYCCQMMQSNFYLCDLFYGVYKVSIK